MHRVSFKRMLSGFALFAAMLMSGCGTQSVITDQPSIELAHADIMPTEQELEGAKHRVVIFSPDDSVNELARATGLAHTLSTELGHFISETGAEIIDRNLANQLEQEIRLAEMHGIATYEGPRVADFALNGTLSTATISVAFSPAHNWVDKKGQSYTVPAKCTYTASISGVIKVYSMTPKLSYLDSLKLDYNYTTTEETKKTECIISDHHRQSFISLSAKNSVKKVRSTLKNLFAPKAYILEAKPHGEDIIFKLSSGTDSGFKAGQGLKIYTRKVALNSISGKESIEDIELVEGEISATIGSNYAWIIVEDKRRARKVRLGDFVKVKYNEGLLGSFGGLIN